MVVTKYLSRALVLLTPASNLARARRELSCNACLPQADGHVELHGQVQQIAAVCLPSALLGVSP
jgi:hypothetical protein